MRCISLSEGRKNGEAGKTGKTGEAGKAGKTGCRIIEACQTGDAGTAFAMATAVEERRRIRENRKHLRHPTKAK